MAPRRLPLAQQLGRRIVQLRVESGMTQEQLAWAVELGSKGYLSRIESGQRLPSLELVDRLARELRVEARDLFTFPDAGTIPAAIEAVRRSGELGAERVLSLIGAKSRQADRTGPSEPAVLSAAEHRRGKPSRRKRRGP